LSRFSTAEGNGRAPFDLLRSAAKYYSGATMSDAESKARIETAALIRRYFEAFNAGDSEAMIASLTDDIIHDVNQGERRTGKDKFRAFNARMTHHYREHLDGIAVMVSKDGQRAAAEFNVVGTYLATDSGLPAAEGQTYRLPAGTFFAIRDGKIARVTTYYNLTDWIAQVSG
jgi:steroid delta-isomerase-like uncharacterized protein